MIAFADIVTGILGAALGVIFGYWLGSRQHTTPIPGACTCGHPRGFHCGGTDRCTHDVHTNLFTLIANGEHNRCTCQVFDGPERPEDIIRGFRS